MSSPTVLPGSSSAAPPKIELSMRKQPGITELAFTLQLINKLPSGFDGLCCAYAMDWLRTRLEAKVFVVSNERITEMAVRHLAQFKAKLTSTESFKKTADAYELVMGHHFDWKVPEEDTHVEWKAPKATRVYLKPLDSKPVTDLPFRSKVIRDRRSNHHRWVHFNGGYFRSPPSHRRAAHLSGQQCLALLFVLRS